MDRSRGKTTVSLVVLLDDGLSCTGRSLFVFFCFEQIDFGSWTMRRFGDVASRNGGGGFATVPGVFVSECVRVC